MIRLLSGAVLAGAALAAIWWLPQPLLRLIACAVAVLAAHEYLRAVQRDLRPARAAPVLLLVAVTCWWMSSPGGAGVLALVLAGLAWLVVEVLARGLTVERAAARFLAPWYVGMPLGLLAAAHAAGGRAATLLLLGTVIASDTAQFYTGRLIGRRPLAPAISPKKTTEGAAGGVVAATLFLVLAGPSALPGASRLSLAAAGVGIALVGICGDLFESRLKRIAGVKDSSTLIPGHGGILDRIDALLFAAPLFYFYLLAVT